MTLLLYQADALAEHVKRLTDFDKFIRCDKGSAGLNKTILAVLAEHGVPEDLQKRLLPGLADVANKTVDSIRSYYIGQFDVPFDVQPPPQPRKDQAKNKRRRKRPKQA